MIFVQCNGLGKEGWDVLSVMVGEEGWDVLSVMVWGRRDGKCWV